MSWCGPLIPRWFGASTSTQSSAPWVSNVAKWMHAAPSTTVDSSIPRAYAKVSVRATGSKATCSVLSAVTPLGQYEPRGHGVSAEETAGQKLPALHGEGAVASSKQKCPAGHGWHTASPVSGSAGTKKVPAGHGLYRYVAAMPLPPSLCPSVSNITSIMGPLDVTSVGSVLPHARSSRVGASRVAPSYTIT